MTFACPFPLPSKGLLVAMSETEDTLISTDCRFISPELLSSSASTLHPYMTRTHQYVLWFPSFCPPDHDQEAAPSTNTQRHSTDPAEERVMRKKVLFGGV